VTTFLNYGPSQGATTLEQVGPVSLWSDGQGNVLRAVQANRYVRVETRGGCFSALNSDFVVEGPDGLRVVRRDDWTYVPVEHYEDPANREPSGPPQRQIRPVPEVPPVGPIVVLGVEEPVEQFPAQMGNKLPIEIPPRWRLERQNLEPIRALCDKAGLSHLGRRPDLINRLREYAEKTAAR